MYMSVWLVVVVDVVCGCFLFVDQSVKKRMVPSTTLLPLQTLQKKHVDFIFIHLRYIPPLRTDDL